MSKLDDFEKDLAEVINRHGMASQCETPDYVLAEYVVLILGSYKQARLKAKNYSRDMITRGKFI